MASKINKDSILSKIAEINDTGKVTGGAYRAIQRAVKASDDIDILRECSRCEQVAHLALAKAEFPREELISAFMDNPPKMRQEALRSKHSAFLYSELSDQFKVSDYAGFIGSEYCTKKNHDDIRRKLWDEHKVAFINSKHLDASDIQMIAKVIIESDLGELQEKLGTGILFKGKVAIWNMLLDNEKVSDDDIQCLFEMKDYYSDSALMNHYKTPKYIKESIASIMKEHFKKSLNIS